MAPMININKKVTSLLPNWAHIKKYAQIWSRKENKKLGKRLVDSLIYKEMIQLRQSSSDFYIFNLIVLARI